MNKKKKTELIVPLLKKLVTQTQFNIKEWDFMGDGYVTTFGPNDEETIEFSYEFSDDCYDYNEEVIEEYPANYIMLFVNKRQGKYEGFYAVQPSDPGYEEFKQLYKLIKEKETEKFIRLCKQFLEEQTENN